MCLCVYVIILINGFAPRSASRSAPRFAPFTPLTLPITIHCQSTPPAFLQLGGKGLFTAIAVPTQAGLSFRCERKTADFWSYNSGAQPMSDLSRERDSNLPCESYGT